MNRLRIQLLVLTCAAALAACGREVDAAARAPSVAPELGDEWRHLGVNTARVSTARKWDGSLDGPVTFWHDSGVKMGEGAYYQGDKNGPWSFWHPNGALRWRGTFANGVPTGAQQAWFDNGQMHYDAHWESGVREGAFKAWHDNGRPALEATYVDDRAEGALRSWNEDGQLDTRISGVYRAGRKAAELAGDVTASAK